MTARTIPAPKPLWWCRPAALCLLALLAACTPGTPDKPVTGPAQLLTPEEETAKGLEIHSRYLFQNGGILRNPQLSEYVNKVGQRIAAVADLSGQKVDFTILDTEISTASTTLGGQIYISRGILALADSEAELAAVLGHEVAHVALRHSALQQQIEDTAKAARHALPDLLSRLTGGRSGSNAVLIESIMHDHEFIADRLSVQYLHRAGYDPAAMGRMLAKFRAYDVLHDPHSERSGRFTLSIISHPDYHARLRQTDEAVGSLPAKPRIAADPSLLDHLSALPYGPDPRKGIVRGQEFHALAAGFKISLPASFNLRITAEGLLANSDDHLRVRTKFFTRHRYGTRPADLLAKGVLFGGKPIETMTVAGRTAWIFRLPAQNQAGSADALIQFAVSLQAHADSDLFHQFIFSGKRDHESAIRALMQKVLDTFTQLPPPQTETGPQRQLEIVNIQSKAHAEQLIARMEAILAHGRREFEILNGLKPGEIPAVGSRVKVVR